MNKKNLLKEELKRHMQLLEYTFYMPEADDDGVDDTENLIFGSEKLYEQDPVPGEDPAADPFATPGGPGEEVTTDTEVISPEGEEGDPLDTPAGEEEVEVDAEVDPFGGEEGMEVEDEFAEEPVGGDETVEVDVTDIVDKAEETRTEIEGLTTKMDELMGNFNELSTQVTGMDQVINKIENLEKEIEKRNPTPVERLEMSSLDSFPYSVKLTDYWDDKEGYDNGEEEKDYTLTKQDVDDYSSTEIKNSFDYNKDDEDYEDYEEN